MVQSSIKGTISEQVRSFSQENEGRSPLDVDALLIFYICLMQALIFGPFINQVGFYLDDWLMLSTLFFGPSDWPHAFANYYLTDPKVIIRPVEVLHFAPMFFLFGLKPLGYHIVNLFMESMSAALLFFNLKQFSGSRLLAFITALVFIAYPVHDCTHYWILCSSVSLSLALYLISLSFTLKGVQSGRAKCYFMAALPFALSIFNYEVFLPFAVISSFLVFLIEKRRSSVALSLKQAVFSFLPLLSTGIALFVYQRFVVPLLGLGFLHKVCFDPARILSVLGHGIYVSSPVNALPFLSQQVALQLCEPLSPILKVILCLVFVGTSSFVFLLFREESGAISPRRLWEFFLVGLAVIVVSLSIFGLAREFEPTLMTLVNRMFTGAAIGWSCIFAAGMTTVALLVRRWQMLKFFVLTIVSICIASVIVFFAVADWQMAQPWVISQRVQNNVQFVLRNLKESIKKSDAIILCDCARYVMWSPVFDGVWDFQSMARIVLGDSQRRAGVVSDRLIPLKDEVKDVSVGYTCGSYPYKDVKVFVPALRQLISTPSVGQFIRTVEAHKGSSQLPEGTIERWRHLVGTEGAKKE